jgi:DNA-3-methyladenine glycosylase
VRNAPMYAAGGTVYVYLIYGMHQCFNVVTEPAGFGAAVLIRAIQPLDGLAAMRALRGAQCPDRDLCRGPGRLAQAFAITRALSGLSMLLPESPITITDGDPIDDGAVARTPRIGVGGDARAKTVCWRWIANGSKLISGNDLANRARCATDDVL